MNLNRQMMKKLLYLILPLLLISVAYGQNPTTILSEVNKKYTSLSSYSADFTVTGTQNMKGTLWAKGKKYKLSVNGQELYNDGKLVYAYLKDINEVNITDYNEGDESDFSPNNIFNLYKKGYDAAYKNSITKAGKKFDVITLTPKARSRITKIELVVGKTDKLINSWTVFERNASTTYTITKFNANAGLSDTIFTFNKARFPGVEIIDLR